MTKFKRLICVDVKSSGTQSNKFYNMTEVPGGTFKVEYGRVGLTKIEKIYSMSDWDRILRSKLKKYDDITHLHEEVAVVNTDLNIDNSDVHQLITELQNFSSQHVKGSYSISASKVTEKMISEARKIIASLPDIVETGDKEKLNIELLKLYKTIPRKMGNVKNFLLNGVKTDSERKEALKLFNKETDTLDAMESQQKIAAAGTKKVSSDLPVDFLKSIGLEIRPATKKEIKEVRDNLMNGINRNFKRLFRVTNIETEKGYQANLKRSKNKSEELLFHGSRNQNWMSIMMNGLKIRPSGAIHTGSMFGDGIYGANKGRKALGYTSLTGSYWAKGGSSKGFMGVFGFHVGSQKHIRKHDSSCYRLSRNVIGKDGFDSVYAHGGIDLRNDEFIVYDNNQVTIRYIIELQD